MSARFSILASGSSGNAAFLEAAGVGVLIDAGIGPRVLASRLRAIGASWERVTAAVLTHTHGDHWNDRTLAYLHRRGVPLYCHAAHRKFLRSTSAAGLDLDAARKLCVYDDEDPVRFGDHVTCRPVAIRHDAGPTYGFRFEGRGDLIHQAWSLAYFADLGCWDDSVACAATDVDLLALEFNHDVELQRRSGRPPYLIERCLGDEGHLSNEQAAELLAVVLDRSQPGRLQHVVQLHLSRQCNEPRLARSAAERHLEARSTRLTTAGQDQATAALALGAAEVAGLSSR